jgi:hypothetical protein
MLEQLGMLASGALGRVGDVLDTPRRLAWQGVNTLLGNENGPENGADLLSRAGMDPESVWTKALGMGVDALTDPTTYLGGLIGRGVGAAAKAAVKPGVKNLLNARRQFAAVKDVGMPAIGEGLADAAARTARGREAAHVISGELGMGRVVGPLEEQAYNQLTKHGELDHIASEMMPRRGQPSTGGMYSDSMNAALTRYGAPNEFVRHELMHGITHNGGGGLPQKLLGKMYESESPFVNSLGFIGDEALAHGAEAHGLGKQMSGAWDFLVHPQPYYQDVIARSSPAAADLWKRGRAAVKSPPRSPSWLAAAAGVPAAAGAAYSLQGE